MPWIALRWIRIRTIVIPRVGCMEGEHGRVDVSTARTRGDNGLVSTLEVCLISEVWERQGEAIDS